MIKILYIGAAPFIGGAERVLLNFLEQVHPDRVGARVVIFGPAGEMSEACKKRNIPTLHVQHIDFFSKTILLRLPFIPFQYLWRLLRIYLHAHKNKPDIFHAWCLPAIDMSAILSLMLKKPSCATLHMGLMVRHVPELRRWSIRLASPNIKKFICVSDATLQSAVESGVPKSKCQTIYNGLRDIKTTTYIHDNFKRKIISRQKIVLSCISVIHERKGQDILLRALKNLKTETSVPWTVNIVGDVFRGLGYDYKNMLLSYVKKSDLSDNVSFVGWKNEIDTVYNETDIVILASLDFDPFPTVLLEATQRGIPVIASNVGGVPEIVAEGDNGWLFPAGDSDKLAQILLGVLEGRRNLSRVTSFRFCIEKQIDETMKVYDQIGC